MFKITHFSDIHLAPLGHIPQSRTEAYHSDVAEELQILATCLKEEKADINIFSGDMFHLKNQSAYSPKDLNYYYKIFQDFPQFHSIPGNHDLPKSALCNLGDSPYTSLKNLLPDIVWDISWQTKTFPFKMGGFTRLEVIGIPYVPMSALKEHIQKFLHGRDISKDTFSVFAIHVDATPEKILLNLWESFTYKDLADMFPNNSLLCMGHIHTSFPPWMSPDKSVFVSKPWSIGRVIKDYFNQTDILQKQHTPSYSVISFVDSPDGISVDIKYKPLPGVKKGTEIFQVQSLQKQLEKSKEIQDLILGLKKNISTGDSPFFVQDPMLYLQSLNIQKEVFDVITEFLNK